MTSIPPLLGLSVSLALSASVGVLTAAPGAGVAPAAGPPPGTAPVVAPVVAPVIAPVIAPVRSPVGPAAPDRSGRLPRVAVRPGAAPTPRAGYAAPSAATVAPWAFPLEPRPVVVRRFDAPPDPYAAGHRGVDLAAALGDVVRSPTVGTVAFAGSVAGRQVVVVTHPGGLRSTLEPVRGSVPLGTGVVGGAPVGTVDAGPGHCAPATCLHWGVLRGETYLDPLRLLTAPRVVLLPTTPGP